VEAKENNQKEAEVYQKAIHWIIVIPLKFLNHPYMAKRNRYAQKAQRTNTSKNILSIANAKQAGIETLIDMAAGAILGAAVGAAVGKPALLVGIVVSGAGHITRQRWLSLVGVGMMASNTYQTVSGVSGVDGLDGLDGVKERLNLFKGSLKDRLYIDKLIKKTDTPVAGIGNLQYFNYPNEVGYAEADFAGGLAELSSIEQQLETSAMSRLPMDGMGANETIEAMEGGLSDVEDYNL
jgi:hypothetical protein